MDEIDTSLLMFAKRHLGFSLYQWQANAIEPFDDLSKRLVQLSLVTPNESGKSSVVIPALALGILALYQQGRVVCTTADGRQLDAQIMPALNRFRTKFPEWKFTERQITTPTGGQFIAFTTDTPGRAEGWHKIDNIEGPLLIIADEAKTIPEPIFSALDRCGYNGILLCSSTGFATGTFYQSQTKTPGFLRIRVGLKDCPHISQEKIDRIIAKWTPDHPFTRSTLHGEFMALDADSAFIVSLEAFDRLMATPPSYEHGEKCAYCDFAAGGDENVLAVRTGNRIELVCWRDTDTMRTVGRFIQEFRERCLSASDIYADAGGLGIPILDRFEELGWPLHRVNNGSTANDTQHYENCGAQAWYKAADDIERARVILPNDEVLRAQGCTRKKKPCSDGRLGLESKKDMAKRGLASPDRFDAVAGVLAVDTLLKSTVFDQAGLAHLATLAQVAVAEAGLVDIVSGNAVYRPHVPGAWLSVWERATPGRSYLAVLDPARHDEPTQSHTFIVLRAGDEKDASTKLAVRLSLPLRCDCRRLADLMTRTLAWFGDPMIVPIVNDRADIIAALMESGANIYVGEQTERIDRHQNVKWGWQSSDYNRSLWIGALSEAIGARTISIPCQRAVSQCQQLTVDQAHAMKDAEAIGVGLRCIGYALPKAGPQKPDYGGHWKPQNTGASLAEIG